MATTTLLILFATLAQASLTPPLPPIIAREDFHNSTNYTNISVGQNTTYPGAESLRDYDTAAYKIYIAFMVFGTISAALMLPVIYSSDALHWRRQKKHETATRQRKKDVAEATARKRQMQRETTRPQQAHTCAAYAFIPATANIAMKIVGPTAHTSDRSGVYPTASCSVSGCKM
ncbi:uncharacterized protein M421DRAFT_95043 [Didymella exigua CBS 183.55]|uniref:Uncharacterized protein n=1 Tax=Didymella exigua CBS 183.55 TaxID=1150837 RepID=A0A6A5RH06_9PLEO|nr:uncharacterized protein M421DRAFT_95043 [Didymella exigua CBS 183.55]KAF1924887.1 hypothetical protein M421DRAFT_95043 [Didymella exigua CBS 183.55]